MNDNLAVKNSEISSNCNDKPNVPNISYTPTIEEDNTCINIYSINTCKESYDRNVLDKHCKHRDNSFSEQLQEDIKTNLKKKNIPPSMDEKNQEIIPDENMFLDENGELDLINLPDEWDEENEKSNNENCNMEDNK